LSLSDYEVLVHLSEAPDGQLRAYQLSRALQWEKSRLSHHLTRMEGRGLVTRREGKTDGRGAFVVLTQEGRAAIEAAAPTHVADVRDAFIDVLTPAQLDTLAEISDAVLNRMSADDTEDHTAGHTT
jgi:DNA-binding MarR family transcriptional regulator